MQTKNDKICDTTYVSTMRAYKLRTENRIEANKKRQSKTKQKFTNNRTVYIFLKLKNRNRIIEPNKNLK